MSMKLTPLAVTTRGGPGAPLGVLCLLLLAGCAALRPLEPIDPKQYASGTAYTYQPLNPTTVWIRDPTQEEIDQGDRDADETSNDFKKALLRDLDTETVRISLSTLTGDSKLSGGVVGVSVAGQSYVLVVDYIKYITSSRKVNKTYTSTNAKGEDTSATYTGTVPMYTGIGLRVRAEFQALQSGLNISGLPALAIAASTNGISGRLTVQTLGITGPQITGLMPLVSDISVSSIQAAVQAVGAIKAKIYEDSTTVFPKIVGFESPTQEPALIRAITEDMYESHEWICPVVRTVTNLEGQPMPVLWIDWFSPPPGLDGPAKKTSQ